MCLSGGDTWLPRIWSVTGVFCFHIPFLQATYRRLVYVDNNRLDAESTNSPFLTWAIIAYSPKLGDALDAQIKDLCLGIFVTNNKLTGYCI